MSQVSTKSVKNRVANLSSGLARWVSPSPLAVFRSAIALALCLGGSSPSWSEGQSSPKASDPQGVTVASMVQGDRLSGLLARSDQSGLSLRTASLGQITLPWATVSSATIADIVRLTKKDGLALIGTTTWQNGRLTIRQGQEDISVALTELATIEWLNQPPPPILERWKLVAGSNLNLSRGNTETLAAALNGSATYQGRAMGVGAYGARSYTSTGSGDSATTTGDVATAGGRADRYLGGQNFVFASVDFKHDRFQQVSRFWGTVGAGRDVVSSEATALSLMLGLSQGRDAIRATATAPPITGRTIVGSRTYYQAQISEGLRKRLGQRGAEFDQSLAIYPQLGTANASVAVEGLGATAFAIPLTGQTRTELSIQLSVPLTKRLRWQGQLQHSYVNQPLPSAKSSDVSTSFGFSLNIGNQSLGGYSGASSQVGSLAGQGMTPKETEGRSR